MSLPKIDFFFAGATKAATASIHQYFHRHPGVTALRDDVHYFSRGIFGPAYAGLEREASSLEDYFSQMPPPAEERKIGDFDRLALHGPNGPALIAQANPEAKILLILRNPVERAYSHYWMDLRECFETRNFLQAVKQDYLTYNSGSAEYCGLIRLGFYARQIQSFREHFPEGQIRIWLYDDFCEDQPRVLREMCEFVGVQYIQSATSGKIRDNVAAVPRSRLSASLLRARRGPLRRPRELYLKLPWGLRREIKNRFFIRRINTPPMEKSAKQLLHDIYRDDIFALQGLLDRDLTHWLRHSDEPLQLPVELQLQQKAKQAEYFDSAQDPEFEIERPAGTGRLYQWSIQSKFNKAVSMLSFPIYGFRILDVCCGSGMGAENYAMRGALVTGLDISEQSLERARERAHRHQFEATFVLGDAENLPFENRSFDIVTVHDGLHHLPNPHAAIAEMARVADRAIVVIEPARSWLTRRAVNAKLALDYEEAGNFVYRFRETEICKIAASAGYTKFSYRQFLLYYRHEPFRWAKYVENSPLFFLAPFIFGLLSLVSPRLGNKICVVCERD